MDRAILLAQPRLDGGGTAGIGAALDFDIGGGRRAVAHRAERNLRGQRAGVGGHERAGAQHTTRQDHIVSRGIDGGQAADDAVGVRQFFLLAHPVAPFLRDCAGQLRVERGEVLRAAGDILDQRRVGHAGALGELAQEEKCLFDRPVMAVSRRRPDPETIPEADRREVGRVSCGIRDRLHDRRAARFTGNQMVVRRVDDQHHQQLLRRRNSGQGCAYISHARVLDQRVDLGCRLIEADIPIIAAGITGRF